MNINKNSFHYKFYCWTYNFWQTRIPTTTNLCQYIQRMIWMPLFIAISILSLVVLFALYAPIMLLLGQRPANPWTKNAFFVPYKLPQVFGFKLYPIYLAAPSIIGFANYYLWK